MGYIHGHFINGSTVSGSDLLSIDNPATGDKVGSVAMASSAEVNQAILAAANAFPAWSATTPIRRARILYQFKALLENHLDELAAMVSREHGKVLDDAKGEVMRGVELVEHMCGIPNLLKGEFSQDVGSGIDCHTVRQALGVCAGVTPFNFPIMVSIWQFVSAIACGNTFVLKPSEKVPSAPMRLAELLKEAGLPDGVFNVVNGDKTAVDVLLNDDRVKAMACVGSTPVAKYIYETGIQNGKRAHAFGGAKNHAILMSDADIDDAANAILGAAFGAAGERCMALPVVVAIGDDIADQLVERLVSALPNLKVAPGDVAGAEMGPLISAEHRDRVKGFVDAGESAGAKLLVDGRDFVVEGSEQGYFFGPCLFDHVTPEMSIYQEEIFGPVLCVLRVADFETALSLINNHPYGNGTAIFTRDGEAARSFASRVQVGMVGINVPIPVPVAYHSFGGWKASVFGDLAMHGEESVRFYTRPKSITTRWTKSGSAFVMPVH